ncbi:transcriptional initiation protein Tat [Methylophaga sp. 42_25_T18]|nr:transcriptional initiation protein Tat [Methylophaga sp. 42_25_T18]OUR85923.1 transcriptional initiation protein Tat [Methylophaga sp. 42_8_T64]
MVDSVNQQRRSVIKGAISASTLALVAASGLLLPQRLLAHWPSDAFNAETVEDALLALVGQAEIADDTALRFKVGSPPSYAVNGASVPIEVQSDLANIERVAVLVAKNPSPLAMSIEPTAALKLPFKSMIKIAEDSDVIAVIRADGKLYKTTRFVEVDIGGCA